MATGGPLGGVAGNYAGQMAGKMIAQKVGRTTKMGSEKQRGVGTKDKSSNKTVKKYITSKKGGLSSDLLHRGVPTVLGGLGGVAGTMATGGPIGGVMGAQAGSQAGQLASDYIGKKIGVGLFPQSKAQKNYKAQQDLQKKYIGNTDNGQKYDVVETGYGLKKKGRPKKEIFNIDIDVNSHNATGKSKTANGSGFKKGSKEAKEKMARLRALRK
jgi:hypothetical protein